MVCSNLLRCCATIALAASASASGASEAPADPASDIVVYGLRDIQAERTLDEADVEGYGATSVGEVLDQLQAETGDEETDEPLLIVNGQRTTDPAEVRALPPEALESVRVMPRGTASRLGGRPTQRVVSVTIRSRLLQAALSGGPKFATDGGWRSIAGELKLTRIRKDTRANLSLALRDDSDLLESERGIVQPSLAVPYAIGGNIVSFPPTGEIDPALSAAAGRLVTVVPLPATGPLVLASLAGTAGQALVTDRGQYRSLRPSGRNAKLDAGFTTRLSPWLVATASLQAERATDHYLRGLAQGLFVLPAGTSASPFSRDVGIAVYNAIPLHFDSRRNSIEGNLSLAATFGRWSATLSGRHRWNEDQSFIETGTGAGALSLPSDGPLSGVALGTSVPRREDKAQSSVTYDRLAGSITGPVLRLPAGDARLTLDGGLEWTQIGASSTFIANSPEQRFRRTAQSITAVAEIPLLSRAQGVLGELALSGQLGRIHYSDAGTVRQDALSLTWEPIPRLRLHGGIEWNGRPPSVQTLGNPVIATPGVRMLDPLTGQTADVTLVTGGNPGLLPEEVRIKRFAALLKPFRSPSWSLSAEYTDLQSRRYISSLPEASIAVQNAFPERYSRDSSGALSLIDLRAVNFDRHVERRLRLGLNINALLGGPDRRPAKGRIGPRTRLQLALGHTFVLSDRIEIRPGLPAVDLLRGGAAGIAGGRIRNQFDANASLASGGTGLRINAVWRGPSTLETRQDGALQTLHFSSVLTISLRAFADLRRVFPAARWARGMRLSVNVANLTNDRQEVSGFGGLVPLSYQPGYRDPLGRTVEVQLRKTF